MSLYRPFRSVLIANRGEIAWRIHQEARVRGLRVIAVYSDADKADYHVERADAAIRLGPAPAKDSYLRIDAVLAAAKASGAEAIHPGYGFLAENPAFAQAVIDAGIVWIGPTPAAILAMGNKGKAKQIAAEAKVPLIPGYQGSDQSEARLAKEAAQIGWPVMIKATNGGGGRGMRRVERVEDFASALASARREALGAFGSEEVILERALDRVRHVEVQVFGDSHGNVVHLGERDCSVQRRNQKIIEEAPCPVVDEALRARMGDAAVRLAKAVNYVNAGTVEFLLDDKLDFYFLEMNTRIQVEHPVTEEVTGTNLIQWQFDVAEGRPLRLEQDEIEVIGHAIEARLCAEDPAHAFVPVTGVLESLGTPGDARVDSVLVERLAVSGHYDSMLAKVIASGPNREAARQKLIRALEHTEARGLRTNRNFLVDVLERETFAKGEAHIAWLGNEPLFQDENLSSVCGDIAALVLARVAGEPWRSTASGRTIVILRERDKTRTIAVENGAVNGRRITALSGLPELLVAQLDHDGVVTTAYAALNGNTVQVYVDGWDALFEDITYAPAERKGGASDGMLRAPMDGKIVAVRAAAGDKVKKGQVLVVLEAMKMEHEIVAALDGVVDAVSVKASDQVSTRQVLVTLKAG